MTNTTNFWENPQHKAIKEMLSVVNDSQIVDRGPNWIASRPHYHRGIYINAALLLDCAGETIDNADKRRDIKRAQEILMNLCFFSLSWAIVRFDSPIDSITLVQAVARRINIGLALAKENTNNVIDDAVDSVIEKAGAGLLNFPAFFKIAQLLGIADFQTLHARFIAWSTLVEIESNYINDCNSARN
jgi:hypothetical protein